MAPHGESIPSSTTYSNRTTGNFSKPPRLSTDSLHRTVSDISFELSKETIDFALPAISEVEEAKCECCGMVEECTPEYIERIRDKFLGKWVCGLCSEAVKEELQKRKNDGGRGGENIEEALAAHMSACVRFNKFGRAYPVLFQAQAMREMLKKNNLDGRRAKSISPRDHKGGGPKKGGIARSSSCIPAITRNMNDLTITSTTS